MVGWKAIFIDVKFTCSKQMIAADATGRRYVETMIGTNMKDAIK